MKKFLFCALAMVLAFQGFSQFDGIVVEEVDNGGLVPGNTYRIYVKVKNVEDQLHAVFGDVNNKLSVTSTEPFYQSEYGGGLSREVNRQSAVENPQLRYDSWFTIGYVDHYSNAVNNFILTFDDFELGKGLITSDGAWFVTPDHKQAYAPEDKKILVAQLTSDGKITGLINLQGRTIAGETWQATQVEFTCGD